LAGLGSLRVLNISFNHLESLPSEAFAGNKELRELHLQGNDLYDLPKASAHTRITGQSGCGKSDRKMKTRK